MDVQRTQIEAVGRIVVDSAYHVHKELGPGLLESTYQGCLAHELRSRNCTVECELELPVRYKGLDIDVGYRIDMIINDLVVIENKSVKKLLPVHEAQILTYLKLSGHRLGYLINWNVPLLRNGLQRLVLRL